MSLINMSNAYLAFSDAPLLDNTELHIEDNERICLVGRNGAGKSTLMRVLTKEQDLDDGYVIYQEDLQLSLLQQDPPKNIYGTVFDFVAEGVKEKANYIKSFHKITNIVEQDPTEKNLNKLAKLQEVLDRDNLWLLDTKINNVIKQLQLPANSVLSALSGGCLRKASLARALVCCPHVLFLDEPTNHLDIDTIFWLESFLKDFQGSIVFISHDRFFIHHMATRIIDLDRGKLVSWSGDYDNYLINKEKSLCIEKQKNIKFNYKLAQEEIWIRKGIKARRTRNEGRIRALKSLRIERSQRREVIGKVKMQLEEGSRSGTIVFDLKNINFYINNKILINNFSVQIQRGDKIALIGPNGCGKTTLLKIILGQLKVNSGNIYRGTNLEIAYFDQYRITLDPNKTVMDNLVEGNQELIINGHSCHALGYLQKFLFHSKQAITPVRALSGGEKNRLLLAKLFLKPSNLLILDEPTNDLDIETIELLEELVDDYQGTVLLVSHDRQFIDNIVTGCWIFEDHGKIDKYEGIFYDAFSQSKQKVFSSDSSITKINNSTEKTFKENPKRKNTKISYHLLKELEQLPIRIEKLESEIKILQSQISASDFFNRPYVISESLLKILADKEAEIEIIFDRWQELELLSHWR
ncbi:MAG: ABC transporter ATP-binding protein [Arsenophonus sp.]